MLGPAWNRIRKLVPGVGCVADCLFRAANPKSCEFGTIGSQVLLIGLRKRNAFPAKKTGKAQPLRAGVTVRRQVQQAAGLWGQEAGEGI